ncbi:MAG: histidine triad nucleotide-binding protein, partial [Deltaproteobacteria bacterium 13_1_40CM_3_69_14]
MDDCIFCKIVAGKIPAKKLGENEGAIAFPDIKPEMPVHILVIPKRHLASLDEVGDGTVMAPVFALAAQVAREQGLDKTGWRAVINTGRDANQVVLHVHLHV